VRQVTPCTAARASALRVDLVLTLVQPCSRRAVGVASCAACSEAWKAAAGAAGGAGGGGGGGGVADGRAVDHSVMLLLQRGMRWDYAITIYDHCRDGAAMAVCDALCAISQSDDVARSYVLGSLKAGAAVAHALCEALGWPLATVCARVCGVLKVVVPIMLATDAFHNFLADMLLPQLLVALITGVQWTQGVQGDLLNTAASIYAALVVDGDPHKQRKAGFKVRWPVPTAALVLRRVAAAAAAV
jgi:hypothetical protein